jgi:O-antigen ligase
LGENINLSGRDAIYKNVWAETMKNPYLGIGLGGDRRVNGEIALYAHNFFIEIFADFGIFIGSIISIVLMLVILKSLIGNNKEQNNMCAIWLSLGFVHLMVSGSYIIDMKFWIFLGILFRNIMCKTKHQNTITVIRENIGNEI